MAARRDNGDKVRKCLSLNSDTEKCIISIVELGWADSHSEAVDKIITDWYKNHQKNIESSIPLVQKVEDSNPF